MLSVVMIIVPESPQFEPCAHTTWSSCANLNVVLTIHSFLYERVSADNTQMVLAPVPDSHHMYSNDRIPSAEGRCLSPLTSFVSHGWTVSLPNFSWPSIFRLNITGEPEVLIWSDLISVNHVTQWRPPPHTPNPRSVHISRSPVSK